MNKKLTRLRIESLFVTLLEVILVGAFLILYLLNIFKLYEIVRTEYIVYAAFALIVLNGAYVWRILIAVNKIRKNSDIRTSDMVGTDINEAYLYGKLGFVVCDETGIVLWESDLLHQRQINIVNENIYEWNPKLRDFIDKDVGNELIITQNDVTYSVKFLRNSGLFIFKDVSDYARLDKYSKEQATCIGVILIDNYEDIAGNGDESNDEVANVKMAIQNYAKEYNLVLRSYKNDSYFVVCNYKDLVRMENDKFSILSVVRKFGVHESIQPTLSIGFAHDNPDVLKLNDLANSAIDTARARGGDQAVISKYGSELLFFGGKTEAVEKKNKVFVRVKADGLLGLIDKASNVVLMGHNDMDMDALGACLGVKAMCDSIGKESYIVYEPKQTERKTRAAIQSLYSKDAQKEIFIGNKQAENEVKDTTLLIVCDTSRPSMTMCPKILENTDKIVVIDHHRRSEEFFETIPVLDYTDASASSASELITELIWYSSNSSKIKVDSTAATIMLSGIFLDTTYYKSKTVSHRTFEASMFLKEFGADNIAASDLLKDEFEEYTLINKILATMKTPYYGIVYCMYDGEDPIDSSTLAKVANRCLQLKGINAAFAIGIIGNDEVKISARSDSSINVQTLAEKFGGGGHLTQAAANFKNKSVLQVEKILLDTLAESLSEARSVKDKKGE